MAYRYESMVEGIVFEDQKGERYEWLDTKVWLWSIMPGKRKTLGAIACIGFQGKHVQLRILALK